MVITTARRYFLLVSEYNREKDEQKKENYRRGTLSLAALTEEHPRIKQAYERHIAA